MQQPARHGPNCTTGVLVYAKAVNCEPAYGEDLEPCARILQRACDVVLHALRFATELTPPVLHLLRTLFLKGKHRKIYDVTWTQRANVQWNRLEVKKLRIAAMPEPPFAQKARARRDPRFALIDRERRARAADTPDPAALVKQWPEGDVYSPFLAAILRYFEAFGG